MELHLWRRSEPAHVSAQRQGVRVQLLRAPVPRQELAAAPPAERARHGLGHRHGHRCSRRHCVSQSRTLITLSIFGQSQQSNLTERAVWDSLLSFSSKLPTF
jgi:hypothetical protein